MDDKILCPKGELIINGLSIHLRCTVDNLPCAFTRYCTTGRCLKMLGQYLGCNNLH